MRSQMKTVVLVLLALGVLGAGLILFWQRGERGQADEPDGLGPKTAPADTPQLKSDRSAVVKGNSAFEPSTSMPGSGPRKSQTGTSSGCIQSSHCANLASVSVFSNSGRPSTFSGSSTTSDNSFPA
jgi:hypothetical protein